MPNINEINKKPEEFKFLSSQDLAQKLDEIDGSDAKLAYAEKYLLACGIGDEDADLLDVEAVLVAKNKIAEAAIKENKSFAGGDLKEDKVKLFIGNPIRYLQSTARSFSNSTETNAEYIRHSIRVSEQGSAYADALTDMENRQRNQSLNEKIEDKLPRESNTIADQLQRSKAGFWERVFNRTSSQYKDFEQAMNNLNANRGNRNDVETTSLAYLKHKFPNLKEGQLPTMDQINSLSGAGKHRALLALNAYQSVQEQKNQPKIDQVSQSCKKYFNDYVAKQKEEELEQSLQAEEASKQFVKEEVVKENKIEVEDVKEKDFQNQIAKDIDENKNEEEDMDNLNIDEELSKEEDDLTM